MGKGVGDGGWGGLLVGMGAYRVLTWNLLRHDGYRPYAWPAMLRREPLAVVLPGLRWDVACFQEVSPPGLALLRKLLPEFGWHVGASRRRPRAEALSIAYDRERFTPLGSGRFDHIGGEGGSWFMGGCSWLRLEDRRTRERLLVASAHFPHPEAQQLQMAALVADQVGALAAGDQVVLAGDFNVGPRGLLFQRLAAEGLQRMPQAPRSLMLFGLPLLPIDAVVTSTGLRCASVERISGRSGVVFASDHAGLIATIQRG